MTNRVLWVGITGWPASQSELPFRNGTFQVCTRPKKFNVSHGSNFKLPRSYILERIWWNKFYFYLTQYIQNVISICNQCTFTLIRMVHSFFILSLQNPPNVSHGTSQFGPAVVSGCHSAQHSLSDHVSAYHVTDPSDRLCNRSLHQFSERSPLYNFKCRDYVICISIHN